MPTEKEMRLFDLYRYQLLPKTQDIQNDFFHNIRTLEELKARKNELFSEVLTTLPDFTHRNKPVNKRVLIAAGEWLAMQINAKRSVELENADFKIEQHENWPHVTVIINNDPNIQTIAIERNARAFSSSNTVVRLLRATLEPLLESNQLVLKIEARFESSTFWKLVDEHKGRIVSVLFELVSPNMANISGALKIDLGQINKETNSHRTDIKLNSGDDSVLEIKNNNKILGSLVDYAAEGGGDIALRLKGMKKTIRTSKSVKEIYIDEITLKNLNKDSLNLLRNLFE